MPAGPLVMPCVSLPIRSHRSSNSRTSGFCLSTSIRKGSTGDQYCDSETWPFVTTKSATVTSNTRAVRRLMDFILEQNNIERRGTYCRGGPPWPPLQYVPRRQLISLIAVFLTFDLSHRFEAYLPLVVLTVGNSSKTH